MTVRPRGYDSPMNVICKSLVNLLKRWALFQIHGSGDWVKRSRLKRSVANLSRRFPDALGLAVGEPTEQKDPALSRRAEETRRRDAHAGDLCMGVVLRRSAQGSRMREFAGRSNSKRLAPLAWRRTYGVVVSMRQRRKLKARQKKATSVVLRRLVKVRMRTRR